MKRRNRKHLQPVGDLFVVRTHAQDVDRAPFGRAGGGRHRAMAATALWLSELASGRAMNDSAMKRCLRACWHVMRCRCAVFFIDSMFALGTIVKGHSNRDDLNLYAGTTWQILARLQVTPHFLRVPSKQNPADDPSRGRVASLDADPAVERRVARWPQWADGLQHVTGHRCDQGYP